jgi:hypothetical protein
MTVPWLCGLVDLRFLDRGSAVPRDGINDECERRHHFSETAGTAGRCLVFGTVALDGTTRWTDGRMGQQDNLDRSFVNCVNQTADSEEIIESPLDWINLRPLTIAWQTIAF